MDYQQPPQDPNQQPQQPQQGYDPNAYQQPPQQPQYQAPPPPNYGGYPPPPPMGNYPGKSESTRALVCGIISCVFGWALNWWLGYIPIVGILTCAGAVVLGVVALLAAMKARQLVPPGAGGMATAGLVTGIVGIVFGAVQFFSCGICSLCALCRFGGAIGDIGGALGGLF